MDERIEREKSAPIATATRVPPENSESDGESDDECRSIPTATRVPRPDTVTSHPSQVQPMTASRESTDRDVPAKATLFCLDCDYQSRVDGDWQVVRKNRSVHYICPDCGTEIAVRPTPTQTR